MSKKDHFTPDSPVTRPLLAGSLDSEPGPADGRREAAAISSRIGKKTRLEIDTDSPEIAAEFDEKPHLVIE